MGRKGNENYARTLLLLMEGGMFIAREILRRETQKQEGNLNDFLENYREQLKRRFTQKQIGNILLNIGGARLDDWDIVLLTGVSLEVFRKTLTSREKRDLLVLRNVREELLTNIANPSLDEETFEDLQKQLEEALDSLAAGLESALIANCRKIINRYVYGSVHLPSSLDHLEDMCTVEEEFVEVVKLLREETRTVIDDIMVIVNKAEGEGRAMKESKVIEYTIKPECKNRELTECVEAALIVASDDVTDDEGHGEYAKIRKHIEDMLGEIKQNADVLATYKKGAGLILKVECKTYASMIIALSYMESLQYMERLEMIATALKEHVGREENLYLSCSYSQENMQKLYEDIKTENLEYSRSISLAMRVNNVEGLAHVWDMFQSGGAQNHLNIIAEALSEYLGSKITLKASLDVNKFKQALDQAVGEPQEEMANHEEAEEEAGTKENKEETKENKEETKCADKQAEDEGSRQAHVVPVSVPRRGVEIVAVRAGTRKTTLFDETICEGERDEITDMGFDTRVDARSRDTVENRERREQREVNVSEKEENISDMSSQETGQESKNDTSEHVNVDRTTEQDNAESSINQANVDRSVARRVSYIPYGDIPDAVRGAVNNFYRDIVYMTSRTQETNTTAEGAVSATDTSKRSGPCPPVTIQTSSNYSREVTEPETQYSVMNQETPSARNTREIDMSLRLSSALDAIGMNQEILDQQEERIQISESIMNQVANLSRRHITAHHFGSQAEGALLIGLPSRLDTLIILEDYSILQNTNALPRPSDFRHVIIAEETRPGFVHLPLTDEMCRDISNERSLLCEFAPEYFVQDRPNDSHKELNSLQEEHCGFGGETVISLRMATWPLDIKRKLQQHAIAWAFDTSSDDLINQPLIVVPVGSHDFGDEEFEWRICTAHVEKVLMNSLNIHQRRVYILFRIILKYLVNPQLSQPLTSFMTKNIFLHMAAGTWSDLWNEGSLVLCLNGCLNKTRQFLRANLLPNFFIQDENLIYDRFPLSDRTRANEILLQVSAQPYASIASIQIENVGCLLDIPISKSLERHRGSTIESERTFLQSLNHGICVQVLTYKDFLLEWIASRSTDTQSAIENHYEILKFLQNYTSGSENVKISYLVAKTASSFISTSIASHLVCLALNTIDADERDWYLCASILHFQRGIESDALSSKMKLLTALIAMNHLASAKNMMVDIEVSSEGAARAVCACRRSDRIDYSEVPHKKTRLDKLMKSVCSCVVFLPSETEIIPSAMRYELLRSTLTDPNKLPTLRCGKWAVVDAKVYFGFLNTALYYTMADMERYIGATDVYHRETQMNFLGVFSEFIGNFEKAAEYYRESLHQEPVHNAASWHIALMLYRKWCSVRQAQSMVEY